MPANIERNSGGQPQPRRDMVDNLLKAGDGLANLTLKIEVGAIAAGLLIPPLAPLAVLGTVGAIGDLGGRYAINAVREDRAEARRRFEKPDPRDPTNKMKAVEMKPGEDVNLPKSKKDLALAA